jgi:hypothetical protein
MRAKTPRARGGRSLRTDAASSFGRFVRNTLLTSVVLSVLYSRVGWMNN